MKLGATLQKDSTTFKVWAPFQNNISLKILNSSLCLIPLNRSSQNFFEITINQCLKNEKYFYVLQSSEERCDPVSRYLPEGVFGPTQIIDSSSFEWKDACWTVLPLKEMIFYELHVGTATKEGTFEALIKKLPYFKNLGINCLELMPIAQFSGKWNWGYDGVSPFAVHNTYGNPDSFKQLVNACHLEGIAVCLDVVYNHLGPEGNFLDLYGPYFTDRYKNPWGKVLNFDGKESNHVRNYFIQNALYWIEEYHIDVLRLDAIHAIVDRSGIHFLEELHNAASKLKKHVHIVAENDLNDTRVIRKKTFGGYGLTAAWNDDFHHALHVTLTKEQQQYYADFDGLKDLVAAYEKNYVYDGKYSSYRKKVHGNSTKYLPHYKFLVFSQNHDQIGNRPFGERLSSLVTFKQLQLAAFLTLLSPSVPLLFMGEEYGEKYPFLYFIDLSDQKLMNDIHASRQKECEKEDLHYPGYESFLLSKPSWEHDQGEHKMLFEYYKKLIAIRKSWLPFHEAKIFHSLKEEWMAWEMLSKEETWVGCFCNFAKKSISMPLPFSKVKGEILIFSTEEGKLVKDNLLLQPESVAIIL